MTNMASERRARIYLYASYLYSSCALRFLLDLQKQSNKAGGKLNYPTITNKQIKPMPKEGDHL